MEVIQFPLERKNESYKTWIMVYVKLDGSLVQCGYGGDVVAKMKPPSLRISDGDRFYYLKYFEDLWSAREWLCNIQKDLHL